MERVPVEIVAHLLSFLPLEARRLGTTSKQFERAFRLFHSKKRIPVDLTVFTEKAPFFVEREGRLDTVQPVNIKIATKHGSVTFAVIEGIITVLENSDDYTINFCKSFFTLAEICGIHKPTYRKFLTDFIPLITINSLNLKVTPRKPMSMENGILPTSLLLGALRKCGCGVKTIVLDNFPLQDAWIHLFGEGNRPPPEDRIRLFTNSIRLLTKIEYRKALRKHVKIGVQTAQPNQFFGEMLEIIRLCYRDVEYAETLIVFKGELTMPFLTFHIGLPVRHFVAMMLHGNPFIQMGSIEEFEMADNVSQFPSEFEVKFIDKRRGLDVILEQNDEGAVYRFVSKNIEL